MTDPDLQSRLQALAALPPDHPERGQLAALLSGLDEAERAYWLRIQRESDLFHQVFAAGNAPADLQNKLLALPARPAAGRKSPPSRKRIYAYAACLLVLIPLAIIALMNWPTAPPTYNYGPPLDSKTAAEIADLAVKIHDESPPLTVTSPDPQTVTAALKSASMPFPAMVLTPSEPLTLVGGGVCDFGPARAIFTRWKSGSSTYTVYQFDGAPFHVPQNFQAATVPSSVSKSDRVAVWPGAGNTCTWAVVLENSQTINPFYY